MFLLKKYIILKLLEKMKTRSLMNVKFSLLINQK